MSPGKRLSVALALVIGVLAFGTLGYLLLGFAPLNALYQTVTTISTVGFREVEEFGTAEKLFTMLVYLLVDLVHFATDPRVRASGRKA